jgi:hypothetical protein
MGIQTRVRKTKASGFFSSLLSKTVSFYCDEFPISILSSTLQKNKKVFMERRENIEER